MSNTEKNTTKRVTLDDIKNKYPTRKEAAKADPNGLQPLFVEEVT